MKLRASFHTVHGLPRDNSGGCESIDSRSPVIWTKCGANTLRLPDGKVANGYWNPTNRKVNFNWNNPDYRNANSGARVEISQKDLS